MPVSLADSDKNKGEGREEIASIVHKHQSMLLKKGKNTRNKNMSLSLSQVCPGGTPKFTILWVRKVESATGFSVYLTVKARHINLR